MPNIKCEKCNLYLEDICKENSELNSFKILLKERLKFFGKIPYTITPGIRHNEFTNNSNCDGVLYYKPFDKSPKNSTFEISMNNLNNILYNDDTLLKQNIISNKSDKELKNNITVNKRYSYIILSIVIVILILFVINKL